MATDMFNLPSVARQLAPTERLRQPPTHLRSCGVVRVLGWLGCVMVCRCVGVWVCGCVGVWVCGWVGGWVGGCVGV